MNNEITSPDNKILREFGLITGIIVVCLFGLLLPWVFENNYPRWPWFIAGMLWALALLIPASLKHVYKVWMAIGHALGWLNTRIILGVMFYIVFLPVGLILKILGKDPMNRKFLQSQNTYRVKHAPLKKEHVERPY